MPPCKGYRNPLIVIDTFTGWVEAIPWKIEQDSEVTQALLQEIIPHFGLLRSLQSNNGATFISQITQPVWEALQIAYHSHSAWHPQSSGKVERANGLLKKHHTRLTQELQLSWVQLLPLALLRLRISPGSDIHLSPFELLYGRPFLSTDLLLYPEFNALAYVSSSVKHLRNYIYMRRHTFQPQTAPYPPGAPKNQSWSRGLSEGPPPPSKTSSTNLDTSFPGDPNNAHGGKALWTPVLDTLVSDKACA